MKQQDHNLLISFTPKKQNLVKLVLTTLIFFVGFYPLFAQPSTEEKLAIEYYQSGEYAKAADLFAGLYRKSPGNYFYNYYLNSLLAIQQYSQAENFVKSVQKSQPAELKYQVELGYIYKLSGEQKKAEKLFSKAIKSIGNTRQDYVNLSNAFSSRNLYDYTLEVLNQGKNKFEPPLNIEIADVFQAQAMYSEMIGSYLDMIHNQDKYVDLVKGKFQIILADFGSDKIALALRQELLSRTEKYPNKTIYAEMLYWYSIQKSEFDLALIQAKALDRQFNEGGERVFQLSNILISNKQYDKAIAGFEYILQLGLTNRFYQTSEINLLHVRFKSLTSGNQFSSDELNQLIGDYKKVLGKYGENRNTVDLMRNLAQIQAFWLKNPEEAEKLLEKIMTINGLTPEIQAAVKIELADVQLFQGKKWSASLLYKQVEKDFKNDPIGFEAKFKAAKFFYYVGEMEWAKVQLDVLKGATAKLIANDALDLSLLIDENIDDDSSYTSLSYFSRADLLAWQQRYDEAFAVFDTIRDIFPKYNIQPFVDYRQAEIYMRLNQIDTAIYFFDKVVTSYPNSSIADNAMIELARIYDREKLDLEKALDYYSRILIDYPGSLFTVEARNRFTEIRNGRNIN